MNKTLVFDMDGTIADLYGVEEWLAKLVASNPSPYAEALPLYDMTVIHDLLNMLKITGYKIVVTSWLSKNSTAEYDKLVRQAKKDWLAKYAFPYDEIHLVKYGTTKANCTRNLGGFQILFDDNEKIRKGWTLGQAVDPTENLIEFLSDLLVNEIKNA